MLLSVYLTIDFKLLLKYCFVLTLDSIIREWA